MKSTLLLLAVILGLGVLLTAAQTHIFCPSDQSCTVSALWNYTGGLQSGGVNVLTNPVNLATQVTGTLAGANYAAVNLAAGNVNGGVTGVLPGANMAATNLAGGNNPGGVAGTLPGSSMAVFVGSGASHAVGAVPDPGASAGTTHFLREDATWQTVPPSGVSEATWGGFSTGSFGTIAPATFSETTLTQAHTLKRFTVYVGTPPSGCTTSPVESLVDLNGPTTLTTLTLTNNVQFQDSGTLTVSMTAGHTFAFQNTTASSGCGTQPANGNFTAVFQ